MWAAFLNGELQDSSKWTINTRLWGVIVGVYADLLSVYNVKQRKTVNNKHRYSGAIC